MKRSLGRWMLLVVLGTGMIGAFGTLVAGCANSGPGGASAAPAKGAGGGY
jgi:hypothetical protein